MKIEDASGILILVGGALLANKLGLFKTDQKPGGNVPPAPDPSVPATLSATQAGQLADRMEADFYPGGSIFSLPWERDTDIGACLMQVKNDADVSVLMNAYGSRGTVTNKMNLSQTVSEYLDNDVKTTVNAYYATKGINFAW